MNEIYVFLFATGISIYGSLIAGIVNLNVIYTALKGYKKQAILMSIGGVLPEILYSGIAIVGVEYIKVHKEVFEYMKLGVIPLLIIIGLIFYFQKEKTVEEKAPTASGSFFKGLGLAMLNPQLILFWFIWLLIAYKYFNFEEYTLISPKITFALGTAFGAYLTLHFFVFLSIKYREKIMKWIQYPINKIIGIILIVIGLFQAINLLIFN